MSELKNDLFLRACLRQSVERTPVWMMRQAGRYLEEYRATRAKAGGFLALCKNPELACEVTLQPIDILNADAGILFSDILVVPEAMGMELTSGIGEGPRFPAPIESRADVERLPVPDPEDALGYVMAAVRALRKGLDGRVPLIGFTGSPWTLATYMVEGGGSKNFSKVKAMAFNEPATMHLLLEKLADAVAAYLNAQIANGAQAVQIFDTWGGILTTRDYKAFSLDYMQRIVSQLTREHEGRRVHVTPAPVTPGGPSVSWGGGSPAAAAAGAAPPAATSAALSAATRVVCPRNSRVGANSPSLWPTMFSLTYTGTNMFPLCTATVCPTNSGVTVEARDQVLSTRLSLLAFSARIFLRSDSST